MKAAAEWRVAVDAAHHYERIVARHILGPWAPLLVDAAHLAGGERVLDLACGTGVVARIAAQRVGRQGRVMGIDLNSAMIGVARSLPAPDGALIQWLEGSALAIPLSDASVDVVLCQQGVQFFADKTLALQETRRVLDRPGRLVLSVWSSTGVYNSAVGKALARFVGEGIASAFCASRNVPGKQELECVAAAAGFSEVKVRAGRLDVHLPKLDQFVLEHLAATPVAASIASVDPELRRKIGISVMSEMQSFGDGDGVTYPEEVHLLTAEV